MYEQKEKPNNGILLIADIVVFDNDTSHLATEDRPAPGRAYIAFYAVAF